MDLAWLAHSKPPRILVVGDLILDRFVHGDAARISPEAPVPVVRQREVEHRAGGAANVAANVRALGGRVVVVGVVGADAEGERLAALLEESGDNEGTLVVDSARPTTVKTRVIARHQQVLRVDVEDETSLGEAPAGEVAERALAALGDADALIVSDYAKGVVSDDLLGALLEAARAGGLPVVVDPKSARFERYAPSTLLTPNEAELSRAVGRELRSIEDIESAARAILEGSTIEGFVVTLGERGMIVVPSEGASDLIPAQAREVYDVTGAGDTVTACLGLSLAAGLGAVEAAKIGNAAAAIAVSRVGTSAVNWRELGTLTDS